MPRAIRLIVEHDDQTATAYNPSRFNQAGKKMPVLQSCLLCVAHALGEFTQDDVVEFFGVTRAHARARIYEMRDRGYVMVVDAGGGWRKARYAITRKGRRAIGVLEDRSDAEDNYTRALSELTDARALLRRASDLLWREDGMGERLTLDQDIERALERNRGPT